MIKFRYTQVFFYNAKGVDQDAWINSGGKPDHFAHALVFANVARNLLSYSPTLAVIPSLPLPGKVRIGWQTEEARPRSYLDRR